MKNDPRICIRRDGAEFVENCFKGAAGKFDRKSIAKSIVEGKTSEELVDFIERMLLGIEVAKLEALRRECPRARNSI